MRESHRCKYTQTCLIRTWWWFGYKLSSKRLMFGRAGFWFTTLIWEVLETLGDETFLGAVGHRWKMAPSPCSLLSFLGSYLPWAKGASSPHTPPPLCSLESHGVQQPWAEYSEDLSHNEYFLLSYCSYHIFGHSSRKATMTSVAQEMIAMIEK